jgi:hypothetical protein
MSESSKPEPADAGDQDGSGKAGRMLFSPDEQQPISAVSEHEAQSEREDGVNRGGPTPGTGALVTPADAIPGIVLTADEEQPISPISERNALSEREDGTNRG